MRIQLMLKRSHYALQKLWPFHLLSVPRRRLVAKNFELMNRAFAAGIRLLLCYIYA